MILAPVGGPGPGSPRLRLSVSRGLMLSVAAASSIAIHGAILVAWLEGTAQPVPPMAHEAFMAAPNSMRVTLTTLRPDVAQPSPVPSLEDNAPEQPRPDDAGEPKAPPIMQGNARPTTLDDDLEVAKVAGTVYLPANKVDVKPLPKSAPDLAGMDLPSINQKVVLRIFVGVSGLVEEVMPIPGPTADDGLLESLHNAFKATAFLPGRHRGVDVATYMDIEVTPNLLH
jgi:hypothetical protein